MAARDYPVFSAPVFRAAPKNERQKNGILSQANQPGSISSNPNRKKLNKHRQEKKTKAKIKAGVHVKACLDVA